MFGANVAAAWDEDKQYRQRLRVLDNTIDTIAEQLSTFSTATEKGMTQSDFEAWCAAPGDEGLNVIAALSGMGQQWLEWMTMSARERTLNMCHRLPHAHFKVEPAGELRHYYDSIDRTDKKRLFDSFAEHGVHTS